MPVLSNNLLNHQTHNPIHASSLSLLHLGLFKVISSNRELLRNNVTQVHEVIKPFLQDCKYIRRICQFQNQLSGKVTEKTYLHGNPGTQRSFLRATTNRKFGCGGSSSLLMGEALCNRKTPRQDYEKSREGHQHRYQVHITEVKYSHSHFFMIVYLSAFPSV